MENRSQQQAPAQLRKSAPGAPRKMDSGCNSHQHISACRSVDLKWPICRTWRLQRYAMLYSTRFAIPPILSC